MKQRILQILRRHVTTCSHSNHHQAPCSHSNRPLTTYNHSNRCRVVVTGMGLVTSLGVGLEHVWRRIIDGDRGICKLSGKGKIIIDTINTGLLVIFICILYTDSSLQLPGFDVLPCLVGGRVPVGHNPGELNLDSHIPPPEQRTMSLATAYALVATEEAVKQSGWSPQTQEEQCRAGMFTYYYFPLLDVCILLISITLLESLVLLISITLL